MNTTDNIIITYTCKPNIKTSLIKDWCFIVNKEYLLVVMARWW